MACLTFSMDIKQEVQPEMLEWHPCSVILAIVTAGTYSCKALRPCIHPKLNRMLHEAARS